MFAVSTPHTPMHCFAKCFCVEEEELSSECEEELGFIQNEVLGTRYVVEDLEQVVTFDVEPRNIVSS